MKIGFLALSGIRAHDPELLALGLTLPGSCIAARRSRRSQPRPAVSGGRARRPDHELEYSKRRPTARSRRRCIACDLVAISTFSAQVFEAYAIADRLRQAGVKVAMGGLHVTRSAGRGRRARRLRHHRRRGARLAGGGRGGRARRRPPRIFDAGDYAPSTSGACRCRATTCSAIARTTASPCRHRAAARGDAISARRRDARPRVPQAARRGRDPRHRGRPAVREHPFIEFADDNTFVDKAWGKELCRQLAPLGVHWFTETDVSVANDPELLIGFHESGGQPSRSLALIRRRWLRRAPEEEPGTIRGPFLQHKVTKSEATVCVKWTSRPFSMESDIPSVSCFFVFCTCFQNGVRCV